LPLRNGDLRIESIVLPPAGTPISESLTRRAVERAVAGRQASYAEELQRIVDAAYRVIERTGTVDPTLRDILRECHLSTQAFYRYFTSKDELLLVLLDDGGRRLLGYLAHRMERATDPEGQIRAWIEGVLAQAADLGAAGRTRPFVANEARLAERFPVEQQASVDMLAGLLVPAIAEVNGGRRVDSRRDADAVYQLAFGALRRHLTRGTRPTRAEVDHLTNFALRGIGGGGVS
jgi:AcrR family transcriptional regulator